MDEKFKISETPIVILDVPDNFDLKQSVEEKIIRISKLEDQLVKEQATAKKEMNKFLLDMLEVTDALDRILERQAERSGAGDEHLLKTVEATRRLHLQKLGKMGVKRMELVGKIMSPKLGDIEDIEDKAGLAPETVLAEIVSGYWWNEQVLRRAKVIVSA